MKISLEWLGDYLPHTPRAEEAADRLTFGGLPVELIERVGDDTVIDVEVTSNRGDCLSHVGIARELGALMSRDVKDVQMVEPQVVAPVETVPVRIEATDACPHYTARLIRGVKVGPSPAWMRRRLEAVGLRSINNIVDVTNYVMFEMGQPLHAFDHAALRGARVSVRRARAGETLVSLDGHERKLEPWMLVIADSERPVALAGVMGGRDSEVTGATVDVLLESARFDPLVVRKTARALAMKSESSYRYERGIDPLLPERASLRATQLIVELAGGRVTSPLCSAGATGYTPKTLTLRPQKLKQVLGIELAPEEVTAALSRIEARIETGINGTNTFSGSPAPSGVGDAKKAGVPVSEAFSFDVPSYRLDLNIEVDLIEEVARLVGYDRIPERDSISIRLSPKSAVETTIDLLRSTLVSAGHFEAVTFSFVTDAVASDFLPEGMRLVRADPAVRKSDANLRPSILPGLLEAVRHNETGGVQGVKLFEIGSTFWRDPSGKLDERRQVSLIGSTDLRQTRGLLETLLHRLDRTRDVRVVPQPRVGYASGASGRVEWGGQIIGYIGTVAGRVCDTLGLRTAPTAVELELEPLLAGAQLVPQLKPLPKYPSVRRDVSLVLSEPTRFEQIDQVVKTVAPDNLEDVEFVTTYRGKPLEPGTKSVTLTLVFRSPDTTLTSEQVDASVDSVVEAARKQLKATLRV